jgi:hypothetical protein
MDILVIGNGFDVAHGLPTKYDQFLDFVKNIKSTEYFRKLSPELQNEYNSLIYDNIWFKHFNDVLSERRAEGKTGWIDFEAEISSLVQYLDKIRKKLREINESTNRDKPYKEYTKYKVLENPEYDANILKMYPDDLNKTKEKAINDLNRLTRCLELYLSDFLNIDSCKKVPLFTDEINPNYVITFNYTDTYERLYWSKIPKLVFYRDKKEQIHYIHGKAKKENTVDDCNLVLGIEEYLEGNDRQKDNEYIEFKKFYQRIYKGTGSTYTKWLQTCKEISEEINVTIYGHSIATTDGDIIKKLIAAAKTTTIYYYGKSALHDIILNLVQIIGEEELIERTSNDSGKGSIIFKSIT